MADICVATEAALFRVDLESQYAVIEHDDGDGESVTSGGFQFGPAVGKAAIAGQANDALVWRGQLGADGHRKAPAQAGDAAWGQKPGACAQRWQVLDKPDRRVACIGDPGDVIPDRGQRAHDGLGMQHAGCRVGRGSGFLRVLRARLRNDLSDLLRARAGRDPG